MNDIAIDKEHLHYLEQLSEMYPTIGKASSEIINLQAILNLPKGTEHFVSDVHGEYEAFSHVLKNGSGAVRKKIDDVFGLAMNKADKAALATLIYLSLIHISRLYLSLDRYMTRRESLKTKVSTR